jgi:FtsP/CotA-like multicopper oxidase with cupredoxin domain
MSTPKILALALAVFATGDGSPARRALPVAAPNENTRPAGTLRNGILTVALEARLATWYPDGDSLPGIDVEAFAEPGREPTVPGPLLRVPAGTEIRATIRNALSTDSLIFLAPTLTHRGGQVHDSVVVAPGRAETLRFRAVEPGNYIYRAITSRPMGRTFQVGGLLTGAIVVDTPATTRPRDRVFVMTVHADSALPGVGIPDPARSVFAINGRSWPHTPRLDATVGDTLRWRVLNASLDVHPMHLHGFYFRIDEHTGREEPRESGRRVVTERMSPFSSMSLTWIPERAGNWLFHCHHQLHVAPHRPLGTSTAGKQAAGHGDHVNHALTGMNGLVLGIRVRPRPGERVAEPAGGRRHLRLLAVHDPGLPDSTPSMRFILEEGGGPSRRRTESIVGFSPTISLTRGEPVSITVVNQLDEPTAVHWHGIELESYHDGVAGFGGFAQRITPIIAPRDSFEARFTPPRAGTFIYHSHVNEVRQQRAGLLGALVVRESAAADSVAEHVLFLKTSHLGGDVLTAAVTVNGRVNPDTLVLRAGERVRLRVVNMTTVNASAAVTLTARSDSVLLLGRDTMLVQWRMVAKDAQALPSHAAVVARQMTSIGETYDFEYVPNQRGNLRLEVRGTGQGGRLLTRLPIRVE